MVVEAPAKLNLRLKLQGLRADGYHLLRMLNVGVSLCDRVRLQTQAAGVSLSVSGPRADAADRGLSDPARNLAARAAQAFLRRFGVNGGVSIALEKFIPAGAGLGGGSSDAAAVLRAMCALFDVEFRAAGERAAGQLSEIALELGADVPYFLRMGCAVVEGIGETVRAYDVPALHGHPLLLLLPPFPLLTKEVYAAFDRHSRFSPSDPALEMFEQRMAQGALGEELHRTLFGLVENDLEDAAVDCEPRMRALLDLVRGQEGGAGGMTGSGSALFFIPDTAEFISGSEADSFSAKAARLGARTVPAELRLTTLSR